MFDKYLKCQLSVRLKYWMSLVNQCTCTHTCFAAIVSSCDFALLELLIDVWWSSHLVVERSRRVFRILRHLLVSSRPPHWTCRSLPIAPASFIVVRFDQSLAATDIVKVGDFSGWRTDVVSRRDCHSLAARKCTDVIELRLLRFFSYYVLRWLLLLLLLLLVLVLVVRVKVIDVVGIFPAWSAMTKKYKHRAVKLNM